MFFLFSLLQLWHLFHTLDVLIFPPRSLISLFSVLDVTSDSFSSSEIISSAKFNLLIRPLKAFLGQVLVARACNSSYLGGGDQKDFGSRPVPAGKKK
jgi:hypothetical protein